MALLRSTDVNNNKKEMFLNQGIFAAFAVFTIGLLSCIGLFVLAKTTYIERLPALEVFRNTNSSIFLACAFVFFLLLCFLIAFAAIKKIHLAEIVTPLRAAIFFVFLTLFYTIAIKAVTQYSWGFRMNHLEEYIFLPAIILLIWAILATYFHEKRWYDKTIYWIRLFTIGIVIFVIYHHASHLINWISTPSKVYWNDLAEAILHGRLYLINPPDTHDLTLFGGKWYVPNPPLPALIYLPFVALFGNANVNAITFSEIIGAVNVVLVYLILSKASKNGILPIKENGVLLLTGLFALGTPHWLLSMLGRMWYLSQLLTLTFAAIALLLALHSKSPWWIGASLGLAVLSRPNVFTLWPFLFAVAIELNFLPFNFSKWKQMAGWVMRSAVPVILAVAVLLTYNYIRFDNFFDFGYVTINGADFILQAVQKYGMFNFHFIPINLKVMLFTFPKVIFDGSCFTFSNGKEGFSLFLATPALIYIFRRFKKSWISVGAVVSILLSVFMLLMYHNTGAEQYGYRYMLDFALPLWFLLAVGVGEKPTWFFKTLVAISVLMSLVGIVWQSGIFC